MMIRSLTVATILLLSPAALACGGAPCDGCDKDKTAMVDAAADADSDAPASNCEKGKVKVATADDVDGAKGSKAAFAVEGMTCGSCSQKIYTALLEMDGVNAVAVSHEDGSTRVAYDSAKLDEGKLIAAVTGLGFQAKSVQ